ncbi:MAG TPA: DedA family protein [Gaiellaceae bacterium]|nr:DedA family protein [Gaiellaceae bacterium]
MFQTLVNAVSGAWWSYFIVFGVAMVDAFFPLVPSETVLITAGVLAGAGDLQLWLVILAGAAGAVAGDNVSFALGTWVGERTVKRWFSGEKAQRRLHWAEHQLLTRGAYIIIVARFIPGGRTATTFAAGYIHAFPWRKFIVYDIAAGLIWATYGALLGYVGGKTFEAHPWKGFIVAFAVASGIALVIEGIRHLRARRGATE